MLALREHRTQSAVLHTQRVSLLNLPIVHLQRGVLSQTRESNHVILSVVPLPVRRGRVEGVRVYAHVVRRADSAIYLSARQRRTGVICANYQHSYGR